MPKTEYQISSQTIWVHWPEAKGQTLLQRAELQPFLDSIIDGVDTKGRPVKEVRVVFSDKEAASYNKDSLAFSRMSTWMAGSPPTPFVDGTPDAAFETREDAGIPSSGS